MQLAEWKLGGRSWTTPLYISPRMGGGPRTYPGGVSKWQWKKMQEKKSKQILKARLLRERQLYEMRKRAELKAADLERPWEITRATRAPTLFAVTADDQLQAMADRFVKPGAIDLWTDKDGPHSYSTFVTQDGKPSARVFPRDALYSTQPYSLASPLPPDQSHNGHSSNSSPSRYLPLHKHDGRSSKLSLSSYPPPQTHNGRSSNPSPSRYPPPQTHNGRSSNPSPSRYPPPQNHNDRRSNPSPSHYLPPQTYDGHSSNPSLSRYPLRQNHNGRSSNPSPSRYPPPQNHNGRSSNPSPSRYPLPQNHNGRSSNPSPSRHPPLQNHNARRSNPSPSRYPPLQNHNARRSNTSPSRYPPHPPHNRNSMSMIGKSIVSRSISVLSSMSGQGKFSDAHITKENSTQKYVKDTGRQRHRFLASPEPSHAHGQDYSSKTKSPVPNSAKHTFAGFDLEKRSTQRIKDASYKCKTDVD